MTVPLLETRELHKKFGGIAAVRNVSIHISPAEILGMIGPNGSGKTSFINLLSGIYRPDAGEIRFAEENIAGLAAHQVTARGIARTFQNLRVFPNISVLENLLVGRHCRIPTSLADIYLRHFKSKRAEKEAERKVLALLDMVGMADRRHETAKNLAYGEQRLLEICRALASEPRLLLLDEPCAGMNPVEMDALGAFLKTLQASGTTIFIIEHNMKFIMSVADRIVVLNAGEKFTEGLPWDIQQDRRVQEIYLGEEE